MFTYALIESILATPNSTVPLIFMPTYVAVSSVGTTRVPVKSCLSKLRRNSTHPKMLALSSEEVGVVILADGSDKVDALTKSGECVGVIATDTATCSTHYARIRAAVHLRTVWFDGLR